MAKRKSMKTPKWVKFIPVALAVVVVCMMFLTVVSYTGRLLGSKIEYTGWQTIFGYVEQTTVMGSTVKTKILGFSFLNLLAIILPIAGALLQLSKSKVLKLVGAICALAGTIMLFLMPNMIVFAENTASIYEAYTSALGVGAIIAGVVAGIETLVIGYEVIAK